MATYIQDTNIPSHGKRSKADNAGTVRIKISRHEGCFITMEPTDFDFYLNINLADKKYHATVETEAGFPPKKQVISVEVPSETLDIMAAIAQDKEFMSIKNDDIFPDMMMLDGYDVKISIKSDVGSLSLDSNMLDDTLRDGILPTVGMTYHTRIHELAAVACESLGIDLNEGEEEEE